MTRREEIGALVLFLAVNALGIATWLLYLGIWPW